MQHAPKICTYTRPASWGKHFSHKVSQLKRFCLHLLCFQSKRHMEKDLGSLLVAQCGRKLPFC